jgi:hypothetical protein
LSDSLFRQHLSLWRACVCCHSVLDGFYIMQRIGVLFTARIVTSFLSIRYFEPTSLSYINNCRVAWVLRHTPDRLRRQVGNLVDLRGGLVSRRNDCAPTLAQATKPRDRARLSMSDRASMSLASSSLRAKIRGTRHSRAVHAAKVPSSRRAATAQVCASVLCGMAEMITNSSTRAPTLRRGSKLSASMGLIVPQDLDRPPVPWLVPGARAARRAAAHGQVPAARVRHRAWTIAGRPRHDHLAGCPRVARLTLMRIRPPRGCRTSTVSTRTQIRLAGNKSGALSGAGQAPAQQTQRLPPWRSARTRSRRRPYRHSPR